ncbi:trypsin-like peptidase domain-containing protein [Streptomyces canus]
MDATESNGARVTRRSALSASTVQVLAVNGAVAGAGFLASDAIVVTCAHVVEHAGYGPGSSLEVRFPHAVGTPRVQGTVLVEGWRAAEGQDVAILRLRESPDARPLLLGAAENSRGHKVSSFGFPAQAPPNGHFGYGRAGDLLAGGCSGDLLQLTNANELTHGFSGGAVRDEVSGLVIGMVTAITEPDDHMRGLGVAYATPTEMLCEVWPAFTAQDVQPYRGLEPFTADDAGWFHGREAAREKVLVALGRERGVLLLGPSGAGKSSLVQAGVLPALAEGRLQGTTRWLPVVARPRTDLLTELERAGLTGAASDGIRQAVGRRLASEPTGSKVLLVVDQAEELFTRSAKVQRPRDPVQELTATVVGSPADVRLLMVLRDDFYPQLAAGAPELLEALRPGAVDVPATLTEPDLRSMIVKPAQDAGARLEDGLPERIITDLMAADPAGPTARQAPVTTLPLLEVTLTQLWNGRQEGHLSHSTYQRIGGVTGSLSAWCDTALTQLSQDRKLLAQRILTALVQPGDQSTPPTRRQVPLRDLRALAVDTSTARRTDGQDFTEVIEVLAHHRLITIKVQQTADTVVGTPTAELIHEALIRDWHDLRSWVSGDHQFQAWLRRTDERRRRWEHSRRPDDLLGGTDLDAGIDWSGSRGLTSEMALYLASSVKRRRSLARRVVRINALLATLLVLALAAAGIAYWQQQTAITAQKVAQSRQLATQSSSLLTRDLDLASLLAVQAYRTSPTVEATRSLYAAAKAPLLRVFGGLSRGVDSATFSPDSSILATSSIYEESVRLWSTESGRALRTISHHDGGIAAVAFSPDGTTLATAGEDNTICLWDIAKGTALRTFSGHSGHPGYVDNGVKSIAFNPNGATLASTGGDGTVRLWNLASGKSRVVHNGPRGGVTSLTFTADGTTLAVSGHDKELQAWDDLVWLWNTETGKLRRKIAPPDGLNTLAFSPDGATLATAGATSDVVLLWNTDTGKVRHTLSDNFGGVSTVLFSPNGTLAVTGVGEATVRLRTPDGDTRDILTGHGDGAGTLAFSPNSAILATADPDSTSLRLWDMTADTAHVTLRGHSNVAAIAFDPDGGTLATGGLDGTTWIWNATKGEQRHVLTGSDGKIQAVAFSPDGGLLATAGANGTARLWDTSSGKVRRTLRGHTDGVPPGTNMPPRGVNSVAFSPNGRILVTAGGDATARLWDTRTGATLHTLNGHKGRVNCAAFSPDGRTIASAGADGTVRLWNASTGKIRRTLTGHREVLDSVTREPAKEVTAVVFSRDGNTLATSGDDGTVRLWDATTGHARTLPSGHRGGVLSVVFSPDGKTLATSGQDGTVRLLDRATGDTRETFAGDTNLVDTVAFNPNGTMLAVTGPNGTVQLRPIHLPEPAQASKQICEALRRDFTPQERSTYLPDMPSTPVCPS